MTIAEAKSIGRKKTLAGTSIVVLILLLFLMLVETNGDFANGILFFIQSISNIYFLLALIILFGLTALFASKAGKEVAIDNKNFVWVSFKYVFIIVLSLYIFSGLGEMIKQDISGKENVVWDYFISPLLKIGSIIFFLLLIVWLWAFTELKNKADAEIKK